MKVFKFGGASVSSADTIKNVVHILNINPGKKIIVVSAMGKTTNNLEVVAKKYFNKDDFNNELNTVINYHKEIIAQLNIIASELSNIKKIIKSLINRLKKTPSLDYNYEYDQIVCFGELISTSIISAYLNSANFKNKWIDVRNCIRTDASYRDASVNWQLTEQLSKEIFNFESHYLYVTQGFIGSTITNQTTTLGREGSDFSAAILANALNAESVTIWKNVAGVLNADPNDFAETTKLDELSYKEAIELSYSGAKIIHPKTMKPLHNKNIPLFVRSFENPEQNGTIIHKIHGKLELPPIFILKKNQALITLEPNDFSFVSINELSDVFNFFKSKLIKVNLIQQSAIDFSLCIDEPEFDINRVVDELSNNFKVKYNNGLCLATIRFYDNNAIQKIKENREILMEQKSRRTVKMVLK